MAGNIFEADCMQNRSLPEDEADEPVKNTSKKGILESNHRADTMDSKLHAVQMPIEAKVQEAAKLIQKLEMGRQRIYEELKQKLEEKDRILSELCGLRYRREFCSNRITWEIDRIHRLEIALVVLRSGQKTIMSRHTNRCSDAEDLNRHSSYSRVVHKSKSLVQERKLLREINEKNKEATDSCSSQEKLNYNARQNYNVISSLVYLQRGFCYHPEKNVYLKQYSKDLQTFKWARKRYVTDADVKGMTLHSLVSRKIVQSAINVINFEIYNIKEEQQLTRAKIRRTEKRFVNIDKDVYKLQKRLTNIQLNKAEAYKGYISS